MRGVLVQKWQQKGNRNATLFFWFFLIQSQKKKELNTPFFWTCLSILFFSPSILFPSFLLHKVGWNNSQSGGQFVFEGILPVRKEKEGGSSVRGERDSL